MKGLFQQHVLARQARPEALEVALGLGAQRLVGGHAGDVGLLDEGLGRRKDARFLQHRLDGGRHGFSSRDRLIYSTIVAMDALAAGTDSHAPTASPVAERDILGDFWPGIQIYYPPVKYAPSLGIYEDLEQAAQRFRKHAWNTRRTPCSSTSRTAAGRRR